MRLSQYAVAQGPVLIQGETGTGKELVANAIHEMSDRAEGPFIVVDCAALPESLLDTELFGHTRGAFTGAVSAREGAFEAAHGGTVFLDEIGELPLLMQPKLLRVLESKAVRRIGESTYRTIDVRFVTATHRDLHAMVGAGAFREDLFFRLAVLPAFLPPLRSRAGDVPLLLAHFLRAAPNLAIPPRMMEELMRHPWLGNVRELRTFADRCLAVGAEEAWALTAGHASEMWQSSRLPPPPTLPASRPGSLPVVPLDLPFKIIKEQWAEHLEREYIGGLLERHGRDAQVIADKSGLDRSYVNRLIRKHHSEFGRAK